MLEVILDDRLGKKVRVKCNEDDTIGDLKKLAAAQLGTDWTRIVIKRYYTVYKDHITLEDYEIHDGISLDLDLIREMNPLHAPLFHTLNAPLKPRGYHTEEGFRDPSDYPHQLGSHTDRDRDRDLAHVRQ